MKRPRRRIPHSAEAMASCPRNKPKKSKKTPIRPGARTLQSRSILFMLTFIRVRSLPVSFARTTTQSCSREMVRIWLQTSPTTPSTTMAE